MNFLHRPLFLAVLVVIGSMIAIGFVSLAQQPESPCAAAELRAATAESHIAAWRLKSEVSAARGDSLEKEIVQLKSQSASAEQQLVVQQEKTMMAQATSRLLVGAVSSAQQKAVELESQRAAVAEERNSLELKIQRANNRWGCRILRIGCIGER